MRVYFQLDFMMISVISEQGHRLCPLQAGWLCEDASILSPTYFFSHEVYILCGVDDNILWIEKGHISDEQPLCLFDSIQ